MIAPTDLTLTLATCSNFHSADACQILTPKHNLGATLRQVNEGLTGTLFTFFVCLSSGNKICLSNKTECEVCAVEKLKHASVQVEDAGHMKLSSLSSLCSCELCQEILLVRLH